MAGLAGARRLMVESTWPDRELPILEAIYAAQEADQDVDRAARAAVPGLSERVYLDTIQSLHDGEFLAAHLVFVDQNRPVRAMIDRLLPKGRQAIKQWPSGDALEAFLEALDRRLAETDDPEEKSTLRRLRDFVGQEGAKGLIGAVIAEALRQAAGAG